MITVVSPVIDVLLIGLEESLLTLPESELKLGGQDVVSSGSAKCVPKKTVLVTLADDCSDTVVRGS